MSNEQTAPVITDEAVEAAARAVSLDWRNYTASMRTALEAAVPLLGPRPLLDRDAATEALMAKWTDLVERQVKDGTIGHCRSLTDAVMEMVRPMPTREALGIFLHSFDGFAIATAESWTECDEERQGVFLYQADALLALLNRSES